MSSRLRPAGPGHRQDGSGTALTAAVILLVAVVAAGLLVIAGYLAAGHHARAAADLVALSGASQQARGGSACHAAARVAAANKVFLSDCRVSGDALDFVVTVIVARQVAAPAVLLPREVTATAHAGRIGLLP
jgi:secretion/DNA translocation related TadE-like protein